MALPAWTITLPNLLKVFAVLAQPRRCATPRASGQGIVAFAGAKPGLALRPARPAPGIAIAEARAPSPQALPWARRPAARAVGGRARTRTRTAGRRAGPGAAAARPPREAGETPPGTTHLRGGRSLLRAPQRLPLLPALPPLPPPGRLPRSAPPAAAATAPLPPRAARRTYAAILSRPVVLNVNPT